MRDASVCGSLQFLCDSVGSLFQPVTSGISNLVTSAIDSWLKGLADAALVPMLHLLGSALSHTPQVTGLARVRSLWGFTDGLSSLLVILFVLAGAVVVMTHESLQTRYGLKEILPRLVAGVVLANVSLLVSRAAVSLADALSSGLLGQGANGAGMRSLEQLVTSAKTGGVFVVVLGLVAALLSVTLLCTYVARVAILVVLVVAAPIALICHALPQTEAVAQLWWRALSACLGIQVAQAVVLLVGLDVLTGPSSGGVLGLGASGLVDLVVMICVLVILVRIPSWAMRAVLGGRRSETVRMLKSYVVIQGLKAVTL
ncbi:MAG: hypothetical protein ACYDGN_12155 [Acidimicrobiales bacterium]